jgi:RNA polymerase sigma factor (TIGR02999 family)
VDPIIPSGTVSQLLADLHAGNGQAKDQLALLLTVELQSLAERFMQRERVGHTLQPGDLVQEVFVRLLQGEVLDKAVNRGYLFGAASMAMRRVLVEYARKRATTKHGGDQKRIPMLDDAIEHYSTMNLDLVALHESLETLQTLNPRQCLIVDEYHFGGFTLREIAEHLEVSEATVSIDLKRAQLWLGARLGGGKP